MSSPPDVPNLICTVSSCERSTNNVSHHTTTHLSCLSTHLKCHLILIANRRRPRIRVRTSDDPAERRRWWSLIITLSSLLLLPLVRGYRRYRYPQLDDCRRGRPLVGYGGLLFVPLDRLGWGGRVASLSGVGKVLHSFVRREYRRLPITIVESRFFPVALAGCRDSNRVVGHLVVLVDDCHQLRFAVMRSFRGRSWCFALTFGTFPYSCSKDRLISQEQRQA